MKSIKLTFLLGLVVIITWSCSNSTSPVNDITFDNAPYAKASRVSTPADSLADLAQNIPGFGGLFINNSEQLSIYLTNPDAQKAKAKAVLSNSKLITEALSNTSATVDNMVTIKGQYTFIQLDSWKAEISNNILPMDDVYLIGIDQSQNKLSIGVKDKIAKNSVNKMLSELNTPVDAVLIYQMSEPEFLIGQ